MEPAARDCKTTPFYVNRAHEWVPWVRNHTREDWLDVLTRLELIKEECYWLPIAVAFMSKKETNSIMGADLDK
jgi:hypothetical protein